MMIENSNSAIPVNAPVEYSPSDVTVGALEHWEHTLENGTVIRGQRTPPSGKPVIHFLHGNGLSGLCYWPMLSGLLPHFDLFLQDLQGHGNSDIGSTFYGWNGNAEQAHRVWQAFASDYAQVETIAMGHSFGGILSLLMAASHPTHFSRLMLLDPVIFPPPMYAMIRAFVLCGLPVPNAMAKRAKERRAHWPSKDAAMDYLQDRGIFKGWSSDAFHAYIDHALTHSVDQGSRLKCCPQRESEIFASAPKHLWRSIKKITIPTTLLYGANSYPFVLRSAEKLQKHKDNFSVIKMEGGHCFMQEKPKETVRQLVSAFNRG